MNVTQEQILDLVGEIDSAKAKGRSLKTALNDLIEEKPEYKAVVEAKRQLDIAAGDLKIALMRDENHQSVKEQIADHKAHLKDLKEILSTHLVTYREEAEADTLEVDDELERPIRVSASLGALQPINERLPFDRS